MSYMSYEGERLAIYWLCYICGDPVTLGAPADIGNVCCAGCGWSTYLPAIGPLYPFAPLTDAAPEGKVSE